MDVLSGLKDAGAQALGNIETATLVIYDYRETAEAFSGVSAGVSNSGAGTVGQLTSSVLTSGKTTSQSRRLERTMRVKFNPSKLTVNASALPLGKKNAEDAGSRTISAEQAKLNLTTVLFFDDMDTYDSFLWDKYVTGLGTLEGLGSAGKAALSRMGRRKAHSVQPEVEALVAALRNPHTRLISFRWNEFAFTGMLNTVQARYTMFSSSGRPVRAQVLLRIQHEMKPSMLEGWYASFEKAFGGGTADLVRAGQKVGNLLNLNL